MTPTKPKPYGEIYVITCTLNGKQYVGQTTRGAGKRWKEHQIHSRRHHSHFHHSLKLYGASNFTLNVVDCADTVEELDEKERHWISVLGTLTPNGFNLTTGGDTAHGKQHSLETRRRIAAAAKDREPRQQSAETRERIGQAHTGMTRSPEAKARMRAAAENKPPVSSETKAKQSMARIGTHRSPETKAKMRAAAMARISRHPEDLEKFKVSRLGKTHTPESKAKMSASQRVRRPISSETSEKIRQSNLKRTHSAETKAKMSATAKARWAAKTTG